MSESILSAKSILSESMFILLVAGISEFVSELAEAIVSGSSLVGEKMNCLMKRVAARTAAIPKIVR